MEKGKPVSSNGGLTMEKFKLRPYQETMVSEILGSLAQHDAVVMWLDSDRPDILKMIPLPIAAMPEK